jgi:hypothetical protein
MRDVPRTEQVVAGAGLDRLVADREGRTAVEDLEALVLPMMHMQRRFLVGRLRDLENGQLPADIARRRLDHGESVAPCGTPTRTSAG